MREICCATANSGAPIDQARWPFFGELWIGPYEGLLPEWTWVAVTPSPEEEVLGYLTGCPDTASFERAKRWRFTLPLAAQVFGRRFVRNGDTRRFLRRTFFLDSDPLKKAFSPALWQRLETEFPAHLHTNLEAGARGSGAGRALCEAFFEKLRTEAVPGMHLFCGPLPVAFYQKVGLNVLERVALRPGIEVFAMGRKL